MLSALRLMILKNEQQGRSAAAREELNFITGGRIEN
jgi:hypothetical protein